MKKIGTFSNEDEKKAEDFLSAQGALVAPSSCRYARAVAPSASPSYHGVESVSFDVAPHGKNVNCFLRFGLEELAEFIDAKAAVKAAQQLHSLGLAPQVLAVDTTCGAILFERLDENWQVATIDRLMLPDMVENLVQMTRKIADSAAFNRPWSVFDGIAVLYAKLLELHADLPVDTDWMMAWMDAIKDAITASGVDLRPAHGDYHCSNILIGEEDVIKLVDFDMAGDMDPYYSLGVLMNELYSFEEEMRPLVEIHDGEMRESSFCRARAYAPADDFYWALRALLMETRSKNRQVEFLKYASWRFLRCRMALRHPDFERNLRKM